MKLGPVYSPACRRVRLSPPITCGSSGRASASAAFARSSHNHWLGPRGVRRHRSPTTRCALQRVAARSCERRTARGLPPVLAPRRARARSSAAFRASRRSPRASTTRIRATISGRCCGVARRAAGRAALRDAARADARARRRAVGHDRRVRARREPRATSRSATRERGEVARVRRAAPHIEVVAFNGSTAARAAPRVARSGLRRRSRCRRRARPTLARWRRRSRRGARSTAGSRPRGHEPADDAAGRLPGVSAVRRRGHVPSRGRLHRASVWSAELPPRLEWHECGSAHVYTRSHWTAGHDVLFRRALPARSRVATSTTSACLAAGVRRVVALCGGIAGRALSPGCDRRRMRRRRAGDDRERPGLPRCRASMRARRPWTHWTARLRRACRATS